MPNSVRSCCKCQQEKSIEEFVKDRTKSTGYSYRCKACARQYQRELREIIPTYDKDQYKKQKDYHANRHLDKKYQASLQDYALFLSKQNGKCAICASPPGKYRLNFDHDHLTKKIRGLLCNKCNVALGFFKDNINSLKNAVNYLEAAGA